MRTKSLFKASLAAFMALGSLVPQTAKAEQILAEDFEYEVGSQLYQQGGWLNQATFYKNSPIKIVSPGLTDATWRKTAVGNAAEFSYTNNGSDQRLALPFSRSEDEAKVFTSGTLYASFLVDFETVPAETSQRASYPFFSFIYSGASDGTNPDNTRYTPTGGVAVYGDAYGAYFGINKATANSGSTPNYQTEWHKNTRFSHSKAHLVVVKYEFAEGSTSDKVSLWVDPTDLGNEPEALVSTTVTRNGQGNITGIALFQGRTSTAYAPSGFIDGIRVATTWPELFASGAVTPPQADPVITAPLQARFADTSVGSTGTVTINVKATDLTEDIALSFDDASAFSSDATSIGKNLAMAEGGYNLNLKFTPTAAGAYNSRLTLSSGTAVRNVDLSGIAVAASNPEIVISETRLNFDKVNVGESRTLTLNVKGVGLTRGISIVPNFTFKPAVTWISLEDATSPEGYNLEVTFSPTEAGLKSGALQFTSTGASYKEVQCNGTGVALQAVAITANPTSVVFPEYTMGSGSYPTKTINVKASGITQDITIGGLGENFKTSIGSISKEAAMSANGYDLAVTYQPSDPGQHYASLTLTAGSVSTTVSLTALATGQSGIKYSTGIQNLADGEDCMYTGTATITYVDSYNGRAYAQDLLGGICFSFEYFPEVPVKVGDEISNVYGFVVKELGANILCVFSNDFAVTDAQKTIEPTVIDAATLKSNLLQNIYKLVRVDNIDFGTNAGSNFSSSMFVRGKVGETEVAVKPFASTTADGVEVPSTGSVAGISISASVVSLSPRSADDLVQKAQDPAVDVQYETLFTGECAPMGVSTPVVKAIVTATALPKATTIWLGGTDRAQFSLSTEEIPAGTSTTEVIISYNPTALKKHTATVNFDFEPTELSTRKSFTFMSYDPANPPAIEYTPATLDQFVAAVGEKQEKEIKITGKNFPDNGTIKVMGEGQGAFVISSTMLSKYGEMTLKITFQPKAEGEFTERIQLDGPMLEPVYITVSGTTSAGPKPEEKEGDELPLSTLNPLKKLIEKFETVENNKVLKLDGWKNVALEGKRAFWGYRTDSGVNGAAKVTAYDSNIAPGEGTPAQMMLVTPALDFRNSASQMLTFRIMGQNLLEGMTDKLEVCYIDLDGDEMYVEPIGGLDIPALADYNNEWRDYVVNLEGQELADVFFIGFRFTSTRGRDNSAVYYIDDVTYGRTDVPFILPDRLEAEFDAVVKKAHTETFMVEGRNLDDDITVTVAGPNASKFSVSPSTLPAAGGMFTLTFLSEETGLHEAELHLSSEGAPTTAIYLTAHNKENTAIEGVDAADSALSVSLTGSILTVEAASEITSLKIFSVDGVLLMTATPDAVSTSINVASLGKRVVVLTAESVDGSISSVKISL